jgi:hypothetical protein
MLVEGLGVHRWLLLSVWLVVEDHVALLATTLLSTYGHKA